MIQANKKYKLVVNIEECGANLKVRLSNRNGNNTYLEQNVQTLGKYEFDYTHEEGVMMMCEFLLKFRKVKKEKIRYALRQSLLYR